uniref:Uncharacterized protein n=1 Tax=Globodera pallida TaxID=36090 RepID=A0A183CBK5_GLOPA
MFGSFQLFILVSSLSKILTAEVKKFSKPFPLELSVSQDCKESAQQNCKECGWAACLPESYEYLNSDFKSGDGYFNCCPMRYKFTCCALLHQMEYTWVQKKTRDMAVVLREKEECKNKKICVCDIPRDDKDATRRILRMCCADDVAFLGPLFGACGCCYNSPLLPIFKSGLTMLKSCKLIQYSYDSEYCYLTEGYYLAYQHWLEPIPIGFKAYLETNTSCASLLELRYYVADCLEKPCQSRCAKEWFWTPRLLPALTTASVYFSDYGCFRSFVSLD